MKPNYLQKYLSKHWADELFEHCKKLDWLSLTNNRQEYFMSVKPLEYTYGNGDNARTYKSNEMTSPICSLLNRLSVDTYIDCLGTFASYNACFLNKYEGQQNQLGWHADNLGDTNGHPIAVISLGAEREIWWKLKDYKGEIPPENRQLLHHGSLFIMPIGMQDFYLHRIPKCDRPCECRISLTCRKFL
jgi:alkylated DNA repair dioxygenase AlkB